ncbi:2845_t:CDS:1, partial [Diversispora eburnea]
ALYDNLKTIIENQLLNLIKLIKTISLFSTLLISEDQYEIYNIITKCWGPSYPNNQHPFFFLTGSA